MRIISGRFKGMVLATPREGTRPTTDRTKEAIFSHLEAWGVLEGARVLDLFAGTGALGLEALSRGADALVAVESSRPAAVLIAKTLSALQRNKSWTSELSARVVTRKAEQFVEGLAGAGDPFDLVFIDPPYAYSTEDCDALLAALTSGGVVASEGVIILERSARSAEPTAPDGWQITQSRNYGETAVFYLESES